MSFNKIININPNTIIILLENGKLKEISSDATKLVNIKTNESFFFKSIKPNGAGEILEEKYKKMVQDEYLFVDNNSNFYRINNLQPNIITIDIGNGQTSLLFIETTKIVNIKTNESFFFKAITPPIGGVLEEKYKKMVQNEYLFVDEPQKLICKFFGGKKSKNQYINKKKYKSRS